MYYNHDGINNVSDVINQAGEIIIRNYYAPFGKPISNYLVSRNNHFRYSSEFYDEKLEATYYNFRHYVHIDGRWTSRDRNSVDDLERTRDLTPYIFTKNSPVNYIDLLGNDWIEPNPNWPPILPPSNRPPTKPTIGITLALNFVASQACRSMSLCKDPCPEKCASCCNKAVAVGMTAATGAYLADCALCAKMVNPIAIAACIGMVGSLYDDVLDSLVKEHENCLSKCLE